METVRVPDAYDLRGIKPGKKVWLESNEVWQERINRTCAKYPNHFVAKLEQRGPLAILGYGPSLLNTWTEIVNCEAIWTVSGAHDFLVRQSVIPTYHTDMDYREHKTRFIKEFQPETRYIMSSMCHDNYLSRIPVLELFHIERPGISYPINEKAYHLYWDVIQQATCIAYDEGYRDIHLFGVDLCMSSNQQAAGEHFGDDKETIRVTCNGWYFVTAYEMIESIVRWPQLLEDHPGLQITVHGEGLLKEYLALPTDIEPTIELKDIENANN